MASRPGERRRPLHAHDCVPKLQKRPPDSSFAAPDLDDEPTGRWKDSPELIAERRITFVKLGSHVRIPEAALDELIAASTVQAAE